MSKRRKSIGPTIGTDLRNQLNGKQLYENYKVAINQFNKSLENEEYIVSFLLAVSLMEERITACYVMLKWYDNILNKEERVKEVADELGIPLDNINLRKFDEKYKPSSGEIERTGIGDKLSLIQKKEYITRNKKDEVASATLKRNNLVHMSFHNIDNYSTEVCNRFFEYYRYFDKISLQIKKDLSFPKN